MVITHHLKNTALLRSHHLNTALHLPSVLLHPNTVLPVLHHPNMALHHPNTVLHHLNTVLLVLRHPNMALRHLNTVLRLLSTEPRHPNTVPHRRNTVPHRPNTVLRAVLHLPTTDRPKHCSTSMIDTFCRLSLVLKLCF